MGAPCTYTLNVGSIVDGWRLWTDFCSVGTKGHFMYPYPSLLGKDGLFYYFDWFSKNLTRLLSLRQDSKFMHDELCTRVQGLPRECRRKLLPEHHLDSRARTVPEEGPSSQLTLTSLNQSEASNTDSLATNPPPGCPEIRSGMQGDLCGPIITARPKFLESPFSSEGNKA